MDDAVSKKVASFFESHRTRAYKKGQVLILNDEMPEHIYYLIEGRVKQYDISPRGEEVILNVFKPPAFFPMSVAVNMTPSPFLFEAETDITLKQAPLDQVVSFVKENPDVLFNLLSRVYRGTDGLLQRMAQLMSGSARSRLLQEVLLECQRSDANIKTNICQLNVNEKELGARAGLSRETVSREMSKLKKEGVITIQHGAITVHAVDQLHHLIANSH